MEILIRCVLSLVLLPCVMKVDFVQSQGLKDCTRTGVCSCKSEKGIVDISPLTGEGSEPKFSVIDGTVSTFFYNPCKDMEYHGVKNGGAFQFYQGKSWYNLGSNKDNAFNVDKDGYPVLTLKAPSGGRRTHITLKCINAGDDKLMFIKENPSLQYNFELQSQYACPSTHPSGGGGSGSLSVGSIILILFFVLIFIYIVLGVILQIGVRKAQGRERIPNVQFWTILPGLVKDGFKFSFTCGRGSYQQI